MRSEATKRCLPPSHEERSDERPSAKRKARLRVFVSTLASLTHLASQGVQVDTHAKKTLVAATVCFCYHASVNDLRFDPSTSREFRCVRLQARNERRGSLHRDAHNRWDKIRRAKRVKLCDVVLVLLQKLPVTLIFMLAALAWLCFFARFIHSPRLG